MLQFIDLGLKGILNNSYVDYLCRTLYGFPKSMSVSVVQISDYDTPPSHIIMDWFTVNKI